MEFEWDPAKEARNLAKHGISFVAAARTLESSSIFEIRSDRDGETRWVAIGRHPATEKIIAVVYVMRDGRYRIISARRARENEEKEYRKQIAACARPEGGQHTQARPDDER